MIDSWLRPLFARLASTQSAEVLLLSMVGAFLVGTAVLMNVVPVHDYVDDVRGAITTDIPPAKLIAEDQFLIKQVYRRVGDPVKAGEPLIRFNGERQSVEVARIDQSLLSKAAEVEYGRQRLHAIEQKVAVNGQIVEGKLRVTEIEADRIQLSIELDARRKKAEKEISAISERILDKAIPALDSPVFSDLEKARILSDAHADLRDMHRITSESRANLHDIERRRLLTRIEVGELRKESADLELDRADALREITALEAELAALRQERKEKQTSLTRLVVRAPFDGVVTRVSQNVRDANLVPRGEELFVVQRKGAEIEAELALTDEQFKDARVGQKVNLELHAWNHYKYGAVEGRIHSISASKIVPQMYRTQEPMFIARVRIVPGQSADLQPGYDFDARILLGKISLFDYMLKKVRIE